VLANLATHIALKEHFAVAKNSKDRWGTMFRPVINNRTGKLHQSITGDGVFKMLKKYAPKAGITVDGLCLHALRAMEATNVLENKSDIAFVPKGLGHANISTTKFYDRRSSQPEDSPTFKVNY
tara:strand:+ start:4846 stop:5214 length:369 start_codon:yes stop_codon:yes gene_type:complete